MLKRNEYLYECDEYKIKNPTEDEIVRINATINSYIKNNEVDYDDPKLNHYLLKELVVSENEDYQFEKYSSEQFIELMENPTKEYKNIVFFIGDLISDISLETARANYLELKKAEIELTRAKIINNTIELNNQVKKEKRKQNELKNQNKKEEITVKKLNKFQIFLYNHGWKR